MKNKNALIILARYPYSGDVKTRLAGHLPVKKRVAVYKYLLENTIRKLKAVPGADSFIAYTPPDATGYFSDSS